MSEEALKKAKTDRRTAKSAFTRAGNALIHAVEHERRPFEVSEAVTKLKGTYDSLVHKHEDYAKLIEDDEAYENEEHLLSGCQQTFMELEAKAKMFIESVEKSSLKEVAGTGVLSKENRIMMALNCLKTKEFQIFSEQHFSQAALE